MYLACTFYCPEHCPWQSLTDCLSRVIGVMGNLDRTISYGSYSFAQRGHWLIASYKSWHLGYWLPLMGSLTDHLAHWLPLMGLIVLSKGSLTDRLSQRGYQPTASHKSWRPRGITNRLPLTSLGALGTVTSYGSYCLPRGVANQPPLTGLGALGIGCLLWVLEFCTEGSLTDCLSQKLSYDTYLLTSIVHDRSSHHRYTTHVVNSDRSGRYSGGAVAGHDGTGVAVSTARNRGGAAATVRNRSRAAATARNHGRATAILVGMRA
ncbi:hypothetical protein CR513_30270, partial [Mucuna pruriens]